MPLSGNTKLHRYYATILNTKVLQILFIKPVVVLIGAGVGLGVSWGTGLESAATEKLSYLHKSQVQTNFVLAVVVLAERLP